MLWVPGARHRPRTRPLQNLALASYAVQMSPGAPPTPAAMCLISERLGQLMAPTASTAHDSCCSDEA
jgi:hypothetical protein